MVWAHVLQAFGQQMMRRLQSFAAVSQMKRLALLLLARTFADKDLIRLKVSTCCLLCSAAVLCFVKVVLSCASACDGWCVERTPSCTLSAVLHAGQTLFCKQLQPYAAAETAISYATYSLHSTHHHHAVFIGPDNTADTS